MDNKINVPELEKTLAQDSTKILEDTDPKSNKEVDRNLSKHDALRNDELEHDVNNKETISQMTKEIVQFLYAFAVIILLASFIYTLVNGVLQNWPLLTFSIILFSFPFSLHFGVLHKLYKNKHDDDSVKDIINTPLVQVIVKVLYAVLDKMNVK